MMLELDGLGIAYQGKELIKAPLNLRLAAGNFYCMLGRNGSGKSSLLRCLLGLQLPQQGQVLLDDKPLSAYSAKALSRKVAYANSKRSDFPFMPLRELLALGRHPYLGFGGRMRPADWHKVEQCLQLLQLKSLEHQPLAYCSDGEFQSAMLGRVLVQDTNLILLDEITAHLDFVHRQERFLLLRQLAENHGKTIILATHSIHEAFQHAHHLLLLHQQELHLHAASDFKHAEQIMSLLQDV